MERRLYLAIFLAGLGATPCLADETNGDGPNPFLEKIFITPDNYANDPPVSGRMAGDNCSACHGTHGRQFDEAIPPLAGIPKKTFIKLMNDFKAGTKKTIVMHQVARAFTEGEIVRMADYFSKMPATPWSESEPSELPRPANEPKTNEEDR